MPPMRGQAVVHVVDRAAGRVRRNGREQRGVCDAEADFLAFHIAARLERARRSIDAQIREGRISGSLGRIADRYAGKEQEAHDREDRPALTLIADHAAEHIRECGADGENQNDLNEVCDRVRVFEWMRRVGIEESASVRAEHLDDFLRSNRPLGDELLSAFKSSDLGVGAQILRHALPHEEQPNHNRDGQEHIKRAAGHIDPEIADGIGVPPREAPDQRKRKRDAGCGGKEVVHREPGHLHEIAHGRFGHVGLPVRIGDKADRGVEGEVGRDRSLPLRVERQRSLKPLQRIERHEPGHAEEQHGNGIGEPALLLFFVDAADPVKRPLDGPQRPVKRHPLAAEHAVHIPAERLGDENDNERIECDLHPA